MPRQQNSGNARQRRDRTAEVVNRLRPGQIFEVDYEPARIISVDMETPAPAPETIQAQVSEYQDFLGTSEMFAEAPTFEIPAPRPCIWHFTSSFHNSAVPAPNLPSYYRFWSDNSNEKTVHKESNTLAKLLNVYRVDYGSSFMWHWLRKNSLTMVVRRPEFSMGSKLIAEHFKTFHFVKVNILRPKQTVLKPAGPEVGKVGGGTIYEPPVLTRSAEQELLVSEESRMRLRQMFQIPRMRRSR